MLVGLKSGIMKNFHSILRCNSRSHSRSFPGITTSHSRSRNAGMEFPFPFPKIGNEIFPFPFPKIGNGIFPFPKVGNEIFHSRSQNLGMGWAIPVPVPKWAKVIPAHSWYVGGYVVRGMIGSRGVSVIPIDQRWGREIILRSEGPSNKRWNRDFWFGSSN